MLERENSQVRTRKSYILHGQVYFMYVQYEVVLASTGEHIMLESLSWCECS